MTAHEKAERLERARALHQHPEGRPPEDVVWPCQGCFLLSELDAALKDAADARAAVADAHEMRRRESKGLAEAMKTAQEALHETRKALRGAIAEIEHWRSDLQGEDPFPNEDHGMESDRLERWKKLAGEE